MFKREKRPKTAEEYAEKYTAAERELDLWRAPLDRAIAPVVGVSWAKYGSYLILGLILDGEGEAFKKVRQLRNSYPAFHQEFLESEHERLVANAPVTE